MESPELLAQILGTAAGSDCVIDGDPPVTIRVLFSRPYQGTNALTGEYASDAPTAGARRGDVAGVIPEQTVLTIEGDDYVVERAEPVEGAGDQWRTLILRRAPAS